MLTSDLVRVRRARGKLHPAYLKGPVRQRALETAQRLLDVFQNAQGKTLSELEQAIDELGEMDIDRVRFAGLSKLLQDRCEFDGSAGADADSLRATLFAAAACSRKESQVRDCFDRNKILTQVAEQLGIDISTLESRLFADLPDAQLVQAFRPITPEGLLQRYDLALAQGVLFRATRVCIELTPSSAPRYRTIFRQIKFCRLMYDVRGDACSGYKLTVDGPLSLFEATQRYGVQLAQLLPVLVAGDGWNLQADILWGKTREPCTFELCEADGLSSPWGSAPPDLEEIDALQHSFARTPSPWTLRREARIFDLQSRGVFVPDLAFEHQQTGELVYLEAFGHWSRDAVFKRLELLDETFPHKVILAVSKKLRVSEQAAQDSFPGRILVYTNSIPLHAVRKALDDLGATGRR